MPKFKTKDVTPQSLHPAIVTTMPLRYLMWEKYEIGLLIFPSSLSILQM